MNKDYEDIFDEEESQLRGRNKGDNMAFLRSSNMLG